MKKIFILYLILILYSCSNSSILDRVEENSATKNTLNLKVNNQTLNEDIVNISASYTCNQLITIYVDSKKNNITSRLFSLTLLKNGQLVSANFTDKKTDLNNDYKTPDFIPSSTFSINNFEFTENKNLNVKFSGKLLKKIYQYNQFSETIDLNGEINVTEFLSNQCNAFNNSIILNPDIIFFDISKNIQGFSQNLNVNYESNSINGYHIKLVNLKNSLLNLPLGTYNFNNSSIGEKIIFQKYIGSPVNYYSQTYVPDYWKTYETEGSFSIVEHTQINGFNVARVKLNFSANFNGNKEFIFNNAEFLVGF